MPRSFSIDELPIIANMLASVAAQELMPRFRTLQSLRVSQKTSPFDLVTEADEHAERAIALQLLRRFPEALVVGEEASESDTTLLSRLQGAPLAFVVDPLDGTSNFASGMPLFGVIVAVVEHGEAVAGLIHDPVCNRTSWAFRGAGAWSDAADGTRSRLRVAPTAALGSMHGIVGTNFLPEPTRSTVNRNLSRLGMTNWFRCAAHEYRLAAAGHCHVLFYNRLMPWDHAAGWLIHREAGGYGAHFDGSQYRPFHTQGGLLCAPDESAWHQVREALLGTSG
ncbi:MAG TPA: inositol monophosphatase [Burkholderiaceae bacterium]|nr:inositol monophosphatase [Burkholderiaceae bacterium]